MQGCTYTILDFYTEKETSESEIEPLTPCGGQFFGDAS